MVSTKEPSEGSFPTSERGGNLVKRKKERTMTMNANMNMAMAMGERGAPSQEHKESLSIARRASLKKCQSY